MDKLNIIDDLGYMYYFLWTITPYKKDLEPNLPRKEQIVQNFIKLSERIGPKRVVLRYDPIIVNNIYTVDYHIKCFDKLLSRLKEYTEKCIISYIDIYKKLSCSAGEMIGGPVDKETMTCIAEKFTKIARIYNIELQTCCEETDISQKDLRRGSCIDKELIERLCGYELNVKKAKGLRELCNCAESVDIGAYNRCAHGCVYCYANSGGKTVYENVKKHDQYSPML
jgi:hypothetical protein